MINNKFSILLGKKLIKISEISRETGISRTTLTNIYYKKSTKISFDVLDKLCNYLECSISDIIEFEK
ncbi:helix-turn-helix transcriptional regulator [Clostridium perfringens]|uniref:Helix-turn-helix transcriptional regulator n=1 Tax=Clostridium perfringens TaxID=1502 RepID=A0AAP4EFP3_CLOPF|nr:helix-turn-helix transcriptional regulator [Clostridium perfringens]MDH2337505.1 helix-turn-helix transcriptional regulator [Clostridium perfringens]MDM0889281.1 helix-turn-helix transcriptional regulator [Clostridium perfringens]MDM0901118.1 helix-turn-helix transcriptional regulator [Clostridium perfringens]MDM0906985.1 helix-turn-helix transcriptional regulator [Clostridium perfringens]MDM0909917.1 helix-turn-helix transcriptional regulator [Clostridium perfringens]